MNIKIINPKVSKKILIPLAAATALTLSAACQSNNTKDTFEKENTEYVQKNSFIQNVFDYDSKLFNNKEGEKLPSIPLRFLGALLGAGTGAFVGACRNESGKLLLSSPKNNAIGGGIIGATLPSITTGLFYTGAAGFIGAVVGTWASKGNSAIGKITAAASAAAAGIAIFL